MSFSLPARGLSTGEIRRLLSVRGVSTQGVFEREELLRILDDSNECAAPEPDAAAPPVNGMDVQDVMLELQARGVEFDVLAPIPDLYDQLYSARGDDDTVRSSTCSQAVQQPQRHTSWRDKSMSSRTPSSPGTASEDMTDLIPQPLRDAIEPIWCTTRDFLAESAGAALSELQPGAQAAAKAASRTPSRLVQKLRAQSKKLQLPSKPILLALCICALKFGFVRTALAGISLKLALELTLDAASRVWQLRRRCNSENEDEPRSTHASYLS